jgi:hypothetical protein
MSMQLYRQARSTAYAIEPFFNREPHGLLQRKSRGNHAIGGECEERWKNRETALQRFPCSPLDPSTRAFFEARFRQDFSQVRVHTYAQAAESAQAINALAYTVDMM